MKKRDILLNTEAHRSAFDQFAEFFHAVEQDEGMRPFEVLTAWMEAAYCSMRGVIVRHALLDEPAWAANEERYMRIVGRCKRPEKTLTNFAKMLGTLTLALEAAPIDFIGPVFTSLAADGFMGQFFTPYEVSKMMASMLLGEPDIDKPITFCSEPACGVGGMVLAANEIFRERGFDIARRVHWDMVDVDATAMHGAFLQVNLTGASARVIHGNSLSLETWAMTPTLAAVMFPKRPNRVPVAWQGTAATSLQETADTGPPQQPMLPPPAPAPVDQNAHPRAAVGHLGTGKRQLDLFGEG